MVEIDIELLAKILSVLGVLGGVLVAVFKICSRFNRMEEEQKAMRETVEHSGKTHRVLMEGLYACLDGLKQQGCNGEVTKALSTLHKHLFEELEQ